MKVGDRLYCYNSWNGYLKNHSITNGRWYIVSDVRYLFDSGFNVLDSINIICGDGMNETFLCGSYFVGTYWYYKNWFYTINELRKLKLNRLYEVI